MRIGIDFDGTTAWTTKIAATLINKEYEGILGHIEPYYSDIHSLKYRLKKLSKSDLFDTIMEKFSCIYGREYMSQINPVPGVESAFKTIKEEGHEIYITSARNDKQKIHADEWLNDRKLDEYVSKWVSPYDLDGNPLTKGEMCINNNLDAIVDDDYEHLKTVPRHIRRYLLKPDCPMEELARYKRIEKEEGIKVCNSWNMIIEDLYTIGQAS